LLSDAAKMAGAMNPNAGQSQRDLTLARWGRGGNFTVYERRLAAQTMLDRM
jgi:hypothetical protein